MTIAITLAAWSEFLTKKLFLNNSIAQWLALLGLLLGALVVGEIIGFFLSRQGKRLQQTDRLRLLGLVLISMSRPVKLLAIASGLYIAGGVMNLVASDGRDMQNNWTAVCKAIVTLALGWFIYRIIDVVEHFLTKFTSKTKTQLDDQLVPLIRKSLRVFTVIVLALFIAQNIFGLNISAMVAGLGIGGLAIALAAKDTLSNLFGSVTIFADRPFQFGDRIKVQGYDGMVEEVGFRSTRIRTLQGHQVVVPNSVIANEPIENVGRRPYIKRVLDVTVTYDTPPEKLNRGVEIIREMLAARSESFPADFPPRVYFSDFNADSLNIVVYYWFTPPEWWEYLEFNHSFNMELLERFNAEKIEFAFPTQTLYVKQDSPLSADIRLKKDK